MTITDFIMYLEVERDSCLAQANRLTNDDCRDEANLLNIRANIFDIFAVVSRTAEKRFSQNQIGFIKGKIDTIPAAWKTSLAIAEKHSENDKIATERIKLQAIAEISHKFNDVMREDR